jgi:plasmid stability protein
MPEMPSVQIKNVPPAVHRVLRRRAATAGQSLQEYLLAQLRQQAEEETLDEVLDRAGGRAGGSLGLAFAAETLRAERGRAG